jgi:hypothetical protein
MSRYGTRERHVQMPDRKRNLLTVNTLSDRVFARDRVPAMTPFIFSACCLSRFLLSKESQSNENQRCAVVLMLAGLKFNMRPFFLNKELIIVTFRAIRLIRIVD